MRFLPRIALLALLVATWPCFAQAPDSERFLDDARQQIADARKELDTGGVDDAELGHLREVMGAIDTQANTLLGDRAPKFDAINARIAELGDAPAQGGESRDIATQRADLDKQRVVLDSEIKRAKLAILDAGQVVTQIGEARRGNFQARLTQRTPSPLTPRFWKTLGGNLGQDYASLDALGANVTESLGRAFSAGNRIAAGIGIALGLLLLVWGRWWSERALMRFSADHVPQGRLRRSAFAFAIVVVTTVFTGLGAQAIVSALDWHAAFSDDVRLFAHTIVNAVFFGSFVAGLARALLSAKRPSWRLPPISDEVATRLRALPLRLGLVVAFSIFIKQTSDLIGASVETTIAGSLMIPLLYAALIAWALLRTVRHVDPDNDDDTRRRPWIGLIIATLWIGVIAMLAAALSGYVALAHQIARQIVGLGIIGASLYLVVHLVEDVFASLLSTQAPWARRSLGLEQRTLDQIAVLCSGLFRVAAFAIALLAALAPFGTEPADLLNQVGHATAGLKVGQIEVTPAAVLSAIAVFVLGFAGIRALQRWMLDYYLPTTRLDPGMRSSVTTLLGSAGIVIVVALALSALGFGLDRIAWVASALSVGIGFGLQAIVQNFVSGLILLVERPVKVGDWVVLGDAEGDIRRINVRATEIQMADRSTVIVPNSELITKSVRNVTLANAEGRVRIRLPLPLESDAARVREIMREAFAANHDVLRQPVPNVLLDGIENGALMFLAVAYIANPRQSGSVRSDLLFDILARLRDERIALSSPQTIKLRRSPRPASTTSLPTDPGEKPA
jgi:small-conductance mechanosensitive channel